MEEPSARSLSPARQVPEVTPEVTSASALRQSDPTTPGDPSSAGTSGLGTSAGTSAASAEPTSTGGAAWRSPSGATYRGDSDAAYRADGVSATGDDELLNLLETIEAQGRRLLRQNRRADDAADAAPPANSDPAAGPHCAHCDRRAQTGRKTGFGADPGLGPGLGRGLGPGTSVRSGGRLPDGRSPVVRGYTGLGEAGAGLSPLVSEWSPTWYRWVIVIRLRC